MKTLISHSDAMGTGLSVIFPADLRAWIEAPRLATIAGHVASLFASMESEDDGSTQSMLALIVYCYAIGIPQDDDIASDLRFDPVLDALSRGTQHSETRLKLFRSHNAELLKACLARLLAQVWQVRHNTSVPPCFRSEAQRRLEASKYADAPVSRDEARSLCRANEPRHVPEMHPAGSLTWAAAACSVLLLLMPTVGSAAEEPLPPFRYQGRSYTNAVVVGTTPVDVEIHEHSLSFFRIKRCELPPELKPLFPYNPVEAAEYAKQQAAKAAARRAEQRAAARFELDQREGEIRSKIRNVEHQLASLQRELDVLNVSARGRPNSAARQEADRYRLRKQDLIRYTDQLRDALDQIHVWQLHLP